MMGCANPRAPLCFLLGWFLLQRWAVGLDYTLASPRAHRWLHEAAIATPDGVNGDLVEQQLVVPLTLMPARVKLRMQDDTVLHVTTRTFNGSVPAPTLVVTPGDHLVFDMVNDLGPGAVNRTSLHLHGLVRVPCLKILYYLSCVAHWARRCCARARLETRLQVHRAIGSPIRDLLVPSSRPRSSQRTGTHPLQTDMPWIWVYLPRLVGFSPARSLFWTVRETCRRN